MRVAMEDLRLNELGIICSEKILHRSVREYRFMASKLRAS